MKAQLLEKKREKVRFIMVGGANTVIDFAILFFLTFFIGLDKIAANYFSTGTALLFSFFTNKSFTFQNKDARIKRQFTLFIAITLFGIWVLQPIVIWGISPLLAHFIHSSAVVLLVAKVAATVFSLTWNYLFYSKLIFKTKEASEI